MKESIRQVYLESKEIYGAPKIRQELLKQGHTIAEKTVGNYMREMGLKACYIRPYTVTTRDPDFDNRLKIFCRNNTILLHPTLFGAAILPTSLRLPVFVI